MIALTIGDVAEIMSGRVIDADPDAELRGNVVTDSRDVTPGDVFFAIRGEVHDGADFADKAFELGAAVAVAEREVASPYILVDDAVEALGALAAAVLERRRAKRQITVIGVTGSVGKTTTKDLLAQVLSPAGETVWPVRSFNNEIGMPITVLRLTDETDFLVLEMGTNGAGQLLDLVQIAPLDIAVVLKVGHAHLGEFGGFEGVAKAKAEILQGIVSGGVAVLNGDDGHVRSMDSGDHRRVLFGQGDVNDVRAINLRADAAGRPRFTLSYGGETAEVELSLVGQHQVHNALAVAAVALTIGHDVATVAQRLSDATILSPHRMAVHELADGITVIDDSYNASPDSMRAALQTLARMTAEQHDGQPRRSVAVLGQMLELGDDSLHEHDALGRLAVRLNIGWLLVIGDGARATAVAAQHEGSWGDEVRLVSDLDEAKSTLSTALQPGDIVLLKGSNGSGVWKLADWLIAERITT